MTSAFLTLYACRMTTIDAVKYHHGSGADTEEDAAWHIGVFLQYCAERGLVAPAHDLVALRADATAYVLTRCGGKLWDSDLTPEGAAFAADIYDAFLAEAGDLAIAAELSIYALRSDPNVGEIRAALFAFLDER